MYLDTTYANPKYVFPPQEESIQYVATTIYHLLQEEERKTAQLHPSPPPPPTAAFSDFEKSATQLTHLHSSDTQQQPKKHRRLFLISTYVIGKERILQAVFKQCNLKIHISDRKSGIMACLPGLPEDMFTSNPHETPVHVVPWGFLGETWPFFRPNWKVPLQYSQAKGADSYIGFVPTGWVHGMAKTPFPVVTKESNTIHLVPYSEHSSFDELIKFVEYLRPVKVIPTVLSNKGDNVEKDKALDKLLRRFTLVTDQGAAKAKFIAKMAGGGGGGGGGKKTPEKGKSQHVEGRKTGRTGGIGGAVKGKVEEKEEGIEEEKVPFDGFGSSDREVDVVELFDSEEEEEEEEKEEKERTAAAAAAGAAGKCDWEVLLDITEGILTPLQAQQLLKTVNGDISRAADVYFEGSWKAGNISNKRSAAANTAASPAGSKRRRTSGATYSAVTDVPTGQRSILSFFSGEATATPAPATVTVPSLQPSIIVEAQPEQQQQQQQQQRPQAINIASIFQRPLPHSSSMPTATATTAKRDAVALPLSQYHPILNAPWHKGHRTPYLHLARAFEAMDSTTKRIAISDILTNTFRSVLILTPEDVSSIAYLAVGKIAPEYEQGMELSLGGSTVAAAVSEATGVTRTKLREMYNELGDLGDVAAKCKHTQATLARPLPLTVAGVHATLRGIAAERGPGAARRRQTAVLMLLRSCREAETKYLVRTLVQALRVGANWRSVVPAVAKAFVIHSVQAEALAKILKKEASPSTSAAAAAQQPPPLPAVPPKAQLDAASTAAIAAFHVCPNLDLLIEAMHAGPMHTLEERCRLTPGVPIKPMLAKISQGIADAITQLKGAPFVAEYKYDGVRAQIHLSASEFTSTAIDPGDPHQSNTAIIPESSTGRVMVFSRNCENKTMSFPDVAQQVIDAAEGGAQSCILDAEVVAVERNNNNNNNNNNNTNCSTILNNNNNTITTATAITTVAGTTTSSGAALRLRPFQDLASRPRGPIDLSSLTVDICVFVFDILECDGVSLLGLPLRERRRALLKALPGLKDGYVQLAQGFLVDTTGGAEKGGRSLIEDTHVGDIIEQEVINLVDDEMNRVLTENDTTTTTTSTAAAAAATAQGEVSQSSQLEDNVETWLLEATAAGTEGLMLKSLDAAYQPSRRSESWIKLKKDYCLGLHESLDLVVIGAWYGSGRKAGWYSPFLLGVIDPETEEIQSLCRCMSGFTDDFYKAATARLKETIIPTKKSYYVTHESPDVWFNATEVWEIRGADLTLSPVHQAAVGRITGSDRGVGLRFPRFLRIRDDKSIDDATTADNVAVMYNAQERKA